MNMMKAISSERSGKMKAMASEPSEAQDKTSSIKPSGFTPWKEKRRIRHSYEHMAMEFIRGHTSDLGEWPKWRLTLHNIFDAPWYSGFMGVVILANAVLVIHETDLKASDDDFPKWVVATGYGFLILYMLEIILRLTVYRFAFFMSKWNMVDLMVVLTDILAELASALGGDNAPSVSVLRIFRLARLLRLIAMLSLFQELQTMLLGFGSAMKAMLWAAAMILVVITVCSIIAVEFIHPLNVEVGKTGVYGDDCPRCARAFETVAESNLTFIQQIIAGDSWGRITIPIIEAYPGSGVFFLIVFGLIDLGVLNLILTVIVNAAESAREKSIDMKLNFKATQTEEMKQNLKRLCGSLDDNDDGKISLDEFMDGVDTNEDFRRTLALLDIQKQDAEVIYGLMDEDGSGEVDYNEFVHTMMSTKHETLNTKLLFLKASVHELHKDMNHFRRAFHDELVVKMQGGDIGSNVKKSVQESAAKMGLQATKITADFDNLSRKMDERWEQLHREHSRSCQILERTLTEASVSHRTFSRNTATPPLLPEGGAFTRQSQMPCLSMPANCTSLRSGNDTSQIVGERRPDHSMEGIRGSLHEA